MNLKQINHDGDRDSSREKLVDGKNYLCGYVSSGDHPIQWVIYRWRYGGFWNEAEPSYKPIDEDELDSLLCPGIILELPDTYVEATKL